MKKRRAIYPEFHPGQVVSHITDDDARGVVVAFMVRANNHTYHVQWGITKHEWHNDFELVAVDDEEPRAIGFWSIDGKAGKEQG